MDGPMLEAISQAKRPRIMAAFVANIDIVQNVNKIVLKLHILQVKNVHLCITMCS